jgi:hypothetical protein
MNWVAPSCFARIEGTAVNEKEQPRPSITQGQIIGVTLGNALEYYDFLVFSFFALQIGHCVFPSDSPTVSLLSALATFGAGFLTRPLLGFGVSTIEHLPYCVSRWWRSSQIRTLFRSTPTMLVRERLSSVSVWQVEPTLVDGVRYRGAFYDDDKRTIW